MGWKKGEGMDNDSQNNLSALKEIRDSVLMLSIGNAYLCEELFLKKIGRRIDVNVEKLKNDISALKKRYPGKFVTEVDTDEILKGIHGTAQRLQKPDKETEEKCTIGKLGQEMEASVNILTTAISTVRTQVEGDSLTYTRKDSVIKTVGSVKSIGSSIGSVFALFLKILFCLIVISILPLSYLFFTMDKEENLLKEIANKEQYIQSQQGILSKFEAEKMQISQEIETMKEKDLSREEKIEMIDLDVKIHKIDEECNKVEVDISLYENEIRDNRRKIKEIKEKSFIRRLLRQ